MILVERGKVNIDIYSVSDVNTRDCLWLDATSCVLKTLKQKLDKILKNQLKAIK